MQTVNSQGAILSPEYHVACNARERRPIAAVHVQWDGSNWIDESANVKSLTGSMGLGKPDDAVLLAKGDIGSLSIGFRNKGLRYSRLASGGDTALRAALANRGGIKGAEVRAFVGFRWGAPIVKEYVKVFHGVVYDWGNESAGKGFNLECRDMGHKYLQNRVSTPLREDKRIDEWINEVADLGGIPAEKRSVEISLFRPKWVWAEDESTVEEIWRAAQADGGWLYWDQQAVMHFRNLLAWVHSASVRTLTADDKSNLEMAPNADMLATEVLTTWQPRQLTDIGIVYNLDERKVVGPGERLTWDAKFSQPVYRIMAQVPDKDYLLASSGGANMNHLGNISFSDICAQRVTVTVENTHAVLPITILYFQLQGIKLTGGPSQELTVQATTSPLPYTNTRKVPANTMIQSDGHARALATFLAERNSRINPLWTLTGVTGVPQLELGDRITFSDAREVAAPRDGHITAINWRFTPSGGFRQDLTLLDREYLFPYDDYFVIGQTALGGGRAWY